MTMRSKLNNCIKLGLLNIKGSSQQIIQEILALRLPIIKLKSILKEIKESYEKRI